MLMLDIESTLICIAVMILQLVILRWVDKRLDYAQMNNAYASDWGSGASSTAPGAAAVGSALRKHRKNVAGAANDSADDQLP